MTEFGFEPDARQGWSDPSGSGTGTGKGAGDFVRAGSREFVHAGKGALCLEVWREGQGSGTSWAGTSRVLPCTPNARVRASVWLYVSSSNNTIRAETTVAQLRVEFCPDDAGVDPACGRVLFSQPIPLNDPRDFDQWRKLEIGGRSSSDARSLRISVLLLSDNPREEKEGAWFDDVSVSIGPSLRMNQLGD